MPSSIHEHLSLGASTRGDACTSADNGGTPGRRLLNTKQVLLILGVKRTTLWEWERTGLISKSRVINGRKYFFSDELDARLDSLPVSKLKEGVEKKIPRTGEPVRGRSGNDTTQQKGKSDEDHTQK